MIGPRNKKIKSCQIINENTKKEIINDINRQGTKGTYREIIEALEKEYKNVDKFVDDVWVLYIKKVQYDHLENIKIQEQINQYNKERLIQSLRSSFKKNIFNDRKKRGLIKKEDDLYSDVIGIDNSSQNLLDKFKVSEAAHIYDVWKIKKNNEENIEYVSNPNNGLIMKHDYHNSFDKGQWTFDSNGNMIVPYENQDYLFRIKGLKRIKINPKVLNEEMKQFLKMK